jgi:hypothetical protein
MKEDGLVLSRYGQERMQPSGTHIDTDETPSNPTPNSMK